MSLPGAVHGAVIAAAASAARARVDGDDAPRSGGGGRRDVLNRRRVRRTIRVDIGIGGGFVSGAG